ncbi:unnamed protein product [[Candida] boidinii]|nr:unnamed protein product [[Candida] boidinii]
MPNSGIGRVKTNKPPPPPPPPLSSLAPPTPPPRPSPSALTGKNQGTQNRSANGTLDSLVPPQSSGYSRAQSHRSQSFDSYYSESSNYPPSPLQYQSKLQPQSPVHSHSLPQLQQHKVPPNYQNSPGHNNNNNNNNNVLNKNNSGSSDDQTSLISYTSVNSEITVSTSNSANGIQSNGNGISYNNSNSIKNSHNSYFANNTQSSGHNTACNNNTMDHQCPIPISTLHHQGHHQCNPESTYT